MSNLDALTDAFAELERQADAASATRHDDLARPTPVRRHHLPLVAASVLAVSAIAGGAALLAQDTGGDRPHARQTLIQPAAGSTPAAQSFEIPKTPEELARRFRAVLGDTAAFTVEDTGTPVTMSAPPAPTGAGRYTNAPAAAQPNGAAIIGTLTAAGVTGGFDLQIYRAQPGDKAWCDDPDRARCEVSRLADGSSLAVEREPLAGSSDGVTYQVDLVRTDGVEFLMHVSNEHSPKGASAVLAARPPLTTDQMTAIVMSDRW